jgi:CheY-specific phosphatase CheX
MSLLPLTLDCLSRHTQQYFEESLGLPVTLHAAPELHPRQIALRDLTAILGLGGPVSFLIAFSLDEGLARHIEDIETQGLDIPEDEREIYLHATVAELANVILGHCTTDLGQAQHIVSMSTPVVVESPRMLGLPDSATFFRIQCHTGHGHMDIVCVSPRELFDPQMNPVSAP